MRIHRFLLAAGALAGLVACAGPEVRYDYDAKAGFAAYQTFDWQAAPRQAAAKAGVFGNDIMGQRVRRAVTEALVGRGYRLETGAVPDFRVTCYPVRQGERSHQVHLGVGMGLGPLGLGVGAPVGDRRADAQGSLVLEVQDVRTRTLVWKATAVKVLEASDSPQEADAAVAGAVKAMLRKFPPRP